MNEQNEMLVSYFSKLASKQKIVWVAEVLRDPTTPKEISHALLTGNIGHKMSNYDALKQGLICRTLRLGQPKQLKVIVYLEKNGEYVKKELKKQEALDVKFEENEKERMKILGDMSKLGRD